MKKKKDSFFSLHFTSIISISLVLFMTGIISMIILSARILTIDTKENIALTVILNDDIEESDFGRLNNYLNASYFTNKVKYISKEDALQEHCEAIGDDPSQFLGYNPLNASLEVYLKADYANTDSINTIVKPKISSFAGIKEIAYQENMLQLFNNNVNKASILLIIIAIVLLLISIVLINNTIRLTIYSKRFIINTMMLVGAKKSFIRMPFIRRSILNGLISAVISIILLAICTYYVQSQIGNTFALYNFEIITPTITIVFILGIFITYIASYFSVNKYINIKTNRLYYI